MAAYVMHATHDPKETTKPARRAFEESFLRKVDPDGVLPVEERERRAAALRKAHFINLARKSAKARAARKTEDRRTD